MHLCFFFCFCIFCFGKTMCVSTCLGRCFIFYYRVVDFFSSEKNCPGFDHALIYEMTGMCCPESTSEFM